MFCMSTREGFFCSAALYHSALHCWQHSHAVLCCARAWLCCVYDSLHYTSWSICMLAELRCCRCAACRHSEIFCTVLCCTIPHCTVFCDLALCVVVLYVDCTVQHGVPACWMAWVFGSSCT
jgi:hypothetical protein